MDFGTTQSQNDFFTHFKKQFSLIQAPSICFDFTFPTCLSSDQVQDLECTVTYEEVKRAVWDCGTNKSPRPDGFSFEFYHKYWTTIADDVFQAISSYLNNAMGSVLVNDSPTLELQFHKGLKQVFIGEWNNNNIQTLLSVLRCFYLASGLKINLHKNKLMEIGVSSNVVAAAASLIGCSILTALFNYLGMKVGSNMSRITSWDDVIFKVPIGVLNHLESICQKKIYGVDGSDRKLAWIGWNMVLTSKKNGGLGVSSFFAHNRALLFKWVWRFLTDGSSLWTHFIKSIFGNKEALDTHKLIPRRSPWQDIILAIHSLQSKGEVALKVLYKRLYALDMCKSISVAEKIADVPTRWLRIIPIKVTVHAWRGFLDKLPTRANLLLRGMDIPSIACPLCNSAVESSSRIFSLVPWLTKFGEIF
uniref:RNA-directed DNA polymerase, eukaryota, reverse transcriptase zinc-binding domain protein n=1 Tax=Tanacetum cinerariifolium TaxID=118510 RepID=A0A699HHT1_TANCI|nr:RNA-directed DNA polymerase, eukaryota, reverse transcriptase zinc-binding domain protein [Tanacetum cinerariifolium]